MILEDFATEINLSFDDSPVGGGWRFAGRFKVCGEIISVSGIPCSTIMEAYANLECKARREFDSFRAKMQAQCDDVAAYLDAGRKREN